jgi:hypothetical protein
MTVDDSREVTRRIHNRSSGASMPSCSARISTSASRSSA